MAGAAIRLTPQVTSVLQDESNELWFSPLSLWEMVQASEKGRLIFDMPVADWFKKSIDGRNFHQATMTNEVALEAARFTLPHRAPIDLLLLATARVYDLTLVTADRNLIAAGVVDTLANR